MKQTFYNYNDQSILFSFILFQLVIDIADSMIPENIIHHAGPTNHASVSSFQHEDHSLLSLPPPPYPDQFLGFCFQCNAPRSDSTANFCSSCGHSFYKC